MRFWNIIIFLFLFCSIAVADHVYECGYSFIKRCEGGGSSSGMGIRVINEKQVQVHDHTFGPFKADEPIYSGTFDKKDRVVIKNIKTDWADSELSLSFKKEMLKGSPNGASTLMTPNCITHYVCKLIKK